VLFRSGGTLGQVTKVAELYAGIGKGPSIVFFDKSGKAIYMAKGSVTEFEHKIGGEI
jgi:thioredoxin-related protein